VDDLALIPPASRINAAVCVALLAYELQSPEAADEVRRLLLPHSDRFAVSAGAVTVLGPVSRYLGLCELVLGDFAAAVDHLRDAVARSESAGSELLATWARVDLAEALLARADAGDRDEARALLDHAVGGAARLGMLRVEAKAAALQVRAGATGNAASSGDIDLSLAEVGITAREAEVLQLVAEGRSNGEIADELYISRKTASVHVSNILRKLGVSSRGQAAAVAHRLGGGPSSLGSASEGAVAAPIGGRGLATIVFLDVVESTRRLVEVGDREWAQLLDRFDDLVGRRAAQHGGRIVKQTGDGVLLLFDSTAAALELAAGMHPAASTLGVRLRAGVHVGEVEHRGADVAGLAVHVAARLTAVADPGETLLSRSVVDLATGSGVRFEERGTRELRGIDGPIEVFTVVPTAS
jgi:class 3 adenylate cyclase